MKRDVAVAVSPECLCHSLWLTVARHYDMFTCLARLMEAGEVAVQWVEWPGHSLELALTVVDDACVSAAIEGVHLSNSDQGKTAGTMAGLCSCGYSWGKHISHPGYQVAGLLFKLARGRHLHGDASCGAQPRS